MVKRILITDVPVALSDLIFLYRPTIGSLPHVISGLTPDDYSVSSVVTGEVLQVAGSATAVPPTFRSPVSITPESGPVGTTYTINWGTVSGTPSPSVDRYLTLGGLPVTVEGGAYTTTTEGTLVATAIARNGVGSPAISSDSAESYTAPIPVTQPAIISNGPVTVGGELIRVRAVWEAGVTVTGEGWYRWFGGAWEPTGETGETYIATTVGDRVTWQETGTGASGYSTTVQAPPIDVLSAPTVLSPPTLTGTPLPGEAYTSTAATFAGYPTPEPSHSVLRQLGTTGAIETVAAGGVFVAGYRYRAATRGWNAAGEVLSYSPWTDVIADAAVAPTVSLARTPSGAITQGDTVTLTATATGTPVPTPVW
ncbi:hypothetical protein, partial [Haematobacter sp. UBA3484]|uniref:hypothetical protein n=1 Tax=Haematobacter sp. UBA3484 TaxID=1946582 RepID=UPI0025C50434